ncbi:MAG: aminopeptidase P family protein [Lachnospiraceae bacterium]|nr:aminopeptidase P family protein [Lachnospiraceae bacterium]
MTVQEKLQEFRKIMKKRKVDAYFITTGDYHCSEYIADYFKEREYMSGFTGSNGDLVITEDECILWTDGRYFIQAEEELSGTEIQLFRLNEDGTQSVEEYLEDKFSDRKEFVVAMDGRTVPADFVWRLTKQLRGLGGEVRTDKNLVAKLWAKDTEQPRPEFVANEAFPLDIRYAGELRSEKLKRLRKKMERMGAYMNIISSLDDICWLLNIRGSDIHCNPVVQGYLLVLREKHAYFFTNVDSFTGLFRVNLEMDGIIFKPYEEVYDFVREFTETDERKKKRIKKEKTVQQILVDGPGPLYGTRILVDMKKINALIYDSIAVKKNIYNMPNPTVLMKAIKNNVEQANVRDAHILDGTAVTKLLYWLERGCMHEKGVLIDEEGEEVTELHVVKKLESLRARLEGYHGPSFDTIAGYGKNGAIVHYTPDERTNTLISEDSFLLLDMGGQYLKGTTDMTRTVFLGKEVPEEMKKNYTLVLKGHLSLMGAQFKKGCSGVALDVLARKPLWDAGLDYNHGTGHGVGYFLNVHEEPNRFAYKISNKTGANPEFEPGMITSCEPGLYFEGKYGIRIENLLLCEERYKNPYGQFLGFRTLTLAPYERKAIDVSLLSDDELNILNNYNKLVLTELSSSLTEKENEWLEEVCAPFTRGEVNE